MEDKNKILLELKFKDGVQRLTNDMGVEYVTQCHNANLKTIKEIAEAFGVPEESLKGVDVND